MKNIVIVALLLALAVGITWTFTADAQSRKAKWKEVEVGSVPSKFGDIVAFTGSTSNYAMIFKDDEGNLRIVEYRGNKVTPRASKVTRSYDD